MNPLRTLTPDGVVVLVIPADQLAGVMRNLFPEPVAPRLFTPIDEPIKEPTVDPVAEPAAIETEPAAIEAAQPPPSFNSYQAAKQKTIPLDFKILRALANWGDCVRYTLAYRSKLKDNSYFRGRLAYLHLQRGFIAQTEKGWGLTPAGKAFVEGSQ